MFIEFYLLLNLCLFLTASACVGQAVFEVTILLLCPQGPGLQAGITTAGESLIFLFFNTVWANSLSGMSYKYQQSVAYLCTVFNRVFLGQKCLILNSTFQCFLSCVLCEYMAGECGGTCLESSGGKSRNIITLNLSLRNTKTVSKVNKDRAVFLI